MIRTSLLCVLGLLLAACGDDGGKAVDAPKAIDMPVVTATVQEVTPCPATPDATIMTVDSTFMFMPAAVTITQGQVVKFMTSAAHNVVPNTSMSDSGLSVGFAATKCLRFTKAGTFGFHCGPHSFMGTVTVN